MDIIPYPLVITNHPTGQQWTYVPFKGLRTLNAAGD